MTYLVVALLVLTVALQVAGTWMRVRTERRTQRLLQQFEQALRDLQVGRLT